MLKFLTDSDITSIISLSRQEFNTLLTESESDLEIASTLDPAGVYSLSDRLSIISDLMKTKAKDNLVSLIEQENTNTVQYHGDIFTLRKTSIYQFSHDKQRDKYLDELTKVEKQIQPFVEKEKGIKESLKQREKTMIKKNLAIETDTSYTISIKKK